MNWKVPYIDYPQQYRKMQGEILRTIDTVLGRGDVMMRQQLRDFESHLAAFVGTNFAVGTSNCTDALHLTLRAAGVGAGDEVITVSHTFVATAAAIHHSGGTPVLVDIGDDHNMDVDTIEAALSQRTKAIIPVHLNGRLCRMDKLSDVARHHGLMIIEDSAQALGAAFEGRKGGNWGIAGCFSFYPAKLLGAYGDGGAVVTDDEEIAERVRHLRDHGRLSSGDISGWSFNCRLDNLQAAILDLKLAHVPEWITRRREIAALYHARLSNCPYVLLPPPPADGKVFFDVFQNYEIEAEDVGCLRLYLKEKGIETMIPWGGKGVHQFAGLGLDRHHLPRTELMFRRALLLPLHCELSDEQVLYVTDSIQDYYRS